MSDTPKQALRRIRTFAEDVAAAQNPGGTVVTVSETDEQATEPVLEIEKVAPVAVFKATAPSSEHIPAFHELKKEKSPQLSNAQPAPPIVAASIPKITVRSKKRDLKKPITASGGVVITDTKRNKQNFVSVFITSVEQWFSSLTAAPKKKHAHTYTVTDTERRKGVIQKATSKTGTIFTADNETLKEEIRRRSYEKTPAPPDADPRLTWTPNTESGYALLTSTPPVSLIEPKRVTVEFKQTSVPEPVSIEPTPAPTPDPMELESVWETSLDTPPTPPPAPAQEPFVEPVASIVAAPEVIVTPQPEPRTIVSPVFREPAAHTFVEAMKDRVRLLIGTFRVNTNFITIGIASILIFAALLALTTRAVLNIINAPEQAPVLAINETPLLPYTSTITLPLNTLTQTALLAALAEKAELTGIVKEYQLANNDAEPLANADTLALLGFTNNQNLNQTITAVHVLTLNSQRGVVFTVTDATTAFGALLSWEPRMLSYLAPVLGVLPNETVFPFTDQTINGIDVRVLTIDGSQRITYGFIAKDTVLITEDIGAFHTMLGRQ